MAKEAGCPAEPIHYEFYIVVSVCKDTGNIHIHLLPKVDRTVKWRRIEHNV
jgi:hypothetical protein